MSSSDNNRLLEDADLPIGVDLAKGIRLDMRLAAVLRNDAISGVTLGKFIPVDEELGDLELNGGEHAAHADQVLQHLIVVEAVTADQCDEVRRIRSLEMRLEFLNGRFEEFVRVGLVGSLAGGSGHGAWRKPVVLEEAC